MQEITKMPTQKILKNLTVVKAVLGKQGLVAYNKVLNTKTMQTVVNSEAFKIFSVRSAALLKVLTDNIPEKMRTRIGIKVSARKNMEKQCGEERRGKEERGVRCR